MSEPTPFNVAGHPIIYVRGYAMSAGEINETTADPFCGFNLGSTVYRATTDRHRARKFIFESPLVRLVKQFNYRDVFNNGLDILDDGWNAPIPQKSIVIYRYYERASNLLGDGITPSIEDFAKDLSDLVLKVRDLVCRDPDSQVTRQTFRCYLVAHSMGGLVCRAFLQNPKLGQDEARRCVDKVFTYATPHNGIEIGGMNVPGWLSASDISNFNRKRMAEYLALDGSGGPFEKTRRVDWLPKACFPPERFFCLVGTNRGDYDAAMGLSRAFAGQGSDGLVKIENAVVSGFDGGTDLSIPTPKAFVYRAHSGHFGIVNSEEAFQNLARFLFGDLRADIWLDIDDVALPPQVREQERQGKTINALYQFELTAAPRAKPWYLTRRVAEEDSVACMTHKEWRSAPGRPKSIYLSTVFLASWGRIDKSRESLAYSVRLGVRVPDYEVDGALWLDGHYEGGYLFNDTVVIEITPPAQAGLDWQVAYKWGSQPQSDAVALKGSHPRLALPFGGGNAPGVAGTLRFEVAPWK